VGVRAWWQEAVVVAERDPAASGPLEVVLFYPGMHALWGHRVAAAFYRRGHRLVARGVASWVRRRTGVDIHPGARIGKRLFIDHATGVVIGETCVIGDDVTIYQGVTLGGTKLANEKRHPTVGDRVVIGAGAKVLGNITVGSDSRIGANAVVVSDVPACSVVVGIPARVVKRDNSEFCAAEMGEDVPDLLGQEVADLEKRMQRVEKAAPPNSLAE